MEVILTVLDILVVLAVVISVSRAVWTGNESRVLSGLLIAVMTIFGLVSVSAASGLANNTSFNEGALLIALVAITIVARISWIDKSAVQP